MNQNVHQNSLMTLVKNRLIATAGKPTSPNRILHQNILSEKRIGSRTTLLTMLPVICGLRISLIKILLTIICRTLSKGSVIKLDVTIKMSQGTNVLVLTFGVVWRL